MISLDETNRHRRRAKSRSRRSLQFEMLEGRRLLAAVPSVSINAPSEVMIGESADIQVAFDNMDPTDPGYGPFIDVYLPTNGADGVAGIGTDGLSYVAGSASYLGVPVTTTVLVFPDDGGGSGIITHPYAVDSTGTPLDVVGVAGNQLLVIELPFGSFTASQPAATISFQVDMSNEADLLSPLAIRSRAGFRYGNDPLDNPTLPDPTLVSQASTSATTWTPQSAITPTLVELTKTFIGLENETATGPNFPRQFRIEIDVADGQTITDADIVDLLPNNIQLLSVDTITPAGSTTNLPTPTPINPPNNDLVVNIPTLTGTTATNDATIVFSYYVPFLDADNANVIDPSNGDDAISQNEASFTGDWAPIDTRDPSGTDNAVADPAGPEETFSPKSIATQKSVTLQNDAGGTGYSDGDTVEYTVSFQISDFFAFDDIVVSDILSDGQRFDTGFSPTLSVTEHGTISSGNVSLANYSIVDHFTGGSSPVAPIDGTQELTFDVSAELDLRAGGDRIVLGGLVPAGGTGGPDPDAATFDGGATTGTLVFRAIVQDGFSDVFPSGDPSVDEGDRLENDVTIGGSVLNYTNLATELTEEDTSASLFNIVGGTLTKEIYAINGNTTLPSPLQLTPGDEITYRLQLSLPNSDVEELTLEDFLPLPVLDAGEVTSFVDVVSAAVPAAGTAKFGPADTFRAIYGSAPTPTSTASNSIRFPYGDFDVDPSVASNIDILFTVTASDDPFADGLFLTNQVRRTQDSTNGGSIVNDAIVPIQLAEPTLDISKGIVATDNPDALLSPASVGPVAFSAPGSAGYRGSAPITSSGLATTEINSNASQLDAGDFVTFAIVVENIGSSRTGAFDVRLRDNLPAGFVIPGSGLNLTVTDGTGAAMPFTTIGAGLFDAVGGIELTDPGATNALPDGTAGGAIDQYDAASGQNILVLTYDLEVAATVTPLQSITNTATLYHYAGLEGGADFTLSDLNDDATALIDQVSVAKSITSTNQGSTSGSDVAIGEIVTYESVLTIPEGVTPSLIWQDTPDSGLAIVDVLSVTPSSGDLSTSPTSFAAVLAGASIPADGSSVTLNFADVTNANRIDTTDETITIAYRAIVLNESGNDRGQMLNNLAAVTWAGGSDNASAPNVTIVEPELEVTKDITPNTGQADDIFDVTLDIAHAAASDADSFEVVLTDALPSGFTFVAATLASAGLAPTTLTESSGTITATWTSFPLASTSEITFQIQTESGVIPSTTITNNSTATWTGLPGDVTTPQSSNGLSAERTGEATDPGAAENDYTFTNSDSVDIIAPLVTKTLINTNQPHTLAADVAIGEISMYEVNIQVPRGSMPTATFVDTPDTGLAIVDVLSVTATADVVTTQPSFASIASSAVIAPGGSSVTFDFGDLSNADATPGVDSITIQYRAVVLNTTTNDRTDVLDNQGNLNWNTSGNVPVDGPDLTIVEPELTITVSDSLPLTGDAGDTVTFTINIAHSGTSDADAFNVDLQNAINSVANHLDYVPGTLNITTAGGAVLNTSDDTGGDLSADWSSFPQGATATVSFDTVVLVSAPASTALVNDADLQWTSLPGDVSAAQSSHSLSVERSGDTAVTGGAANDHAATDSGQVTTSPPGSSKTVVSTDYAGTTLAEFDPTLDDVIIGEQVTFSIIAVASEGTNTLVITDQLPTAPGVLELVSATVESVGGQLTVGAPTITATDSGVDGIDDRVVFDFGSLVNTPDGVSNADDEIEVRVVARVLDVAGNSNSTVLTNTATIDLGGALSVSTADIEIVEPVLNITKTADVTTGPPGTTVSYTVDIAHDAASTAAAFDLSIADLLADPNLTLVPGTVATDRGTITSGNGPTDTTVGVTVASLAQNETVTITLDAIVNPSVTASVSVVNTSTLDYDDFPGVGGRAASENDVETFATTPTEINLAITKADDVDPVVTSSPLQYTLVVTNNGPSTATNVTVTDNLPAGLTGISASSSQGSVGVAGLFVSGNLGTLLPGASATVTIDVTSPATDGAITNNASVTASETETDGTDNSVSEPTLVVSTSSVAGSSWVDTNSNGVLDTGEVVLPGVLVTLTGVNDLGANVSLTTTTDINGDYIFTLLRAGTYRISQTQPTLFADNADFVGTGGGTVSANDQLDLTIPAGVDVTGYNFTELGLLPGTFGKRRLMNSQLQGGNSAAYDAFFATLAASGNGDLDGDTDVDNDDFLLFQDRLGEAWVF